MAELIHAREKLLLKFKKSNLHIDEKNYKKVKYQVQNLIRKKKREFYETNLRQKINKPKELWKTLKWLGLPSKAVTASNICLKDKNEIVFNATKNCSIKKKIIFQVLDITWYVSYLFCPIFLLNLKLHPIMTITKCQKIWIFNF